MARRIALRTARDRVLAALTVGAIGEIGWTIFLGLRLPPHYVARHWDLAWVGLDVFEILMLFSSAWAAWRQRALLIPLSSVTATLFALDAWFDVTTAGRGDVLESALLAGLIEVPAALVLWWISLRALRRLFAAHLGPASAYATAPVHTVPLVPPDADQ